MFKTDKNLSVLERMPFNTSSLREQAYPWTGMGEWEARAARTQQRATRFDTQLERDGISQLITMQITWMKRSRRL